MKTYRSKDEVQVMKIGSIHGAIASEAKQGKKRLVSGDKGCVDLGYTFVGQNVVKVGDYVLFKDDQPCGVMGPVAFEAAYAAKKPPPVEKPKK